MIEYKTLLELSKSTHNQHNLNSYSLFENESNKYIWAVFKTDKNSIIIIPKNSLKLNIEELFIAKIDYDSFDLATQKFGHKNKKKAKIKSFDATSIKIECEDCDFRNNYVIFYKNEIINIILDVEVGGILDKYFYAFNENEFGVRIKNDKIVFKVWSPPAAKIEVILFDSKNNVLDNRLNLNKLENGIWHGEFSLNQIGIECFDGFYYQYIVYAYGKVKLALDPYAFSMQTFSPYGEDKIGKAAIIDINSKNYIDNASKKCFYNHNFIANENDIVVYELHVRDFTIDPELQINSVAGTFTALTEKISYLKNLGITHVQLMPVMSFYTVDENNKTFSDSNSSSINYNWGYDPLNFFSLSGWYSSNPENPNCRILEFQNLVNELNNNNIGVVLDVVFNHTYIAETFENIAPGCYYRHTKDLKISGHAGVGPVIESRHKMIRKFIIDSLKHWVNIYNVDGFRFDLISFMDHETIIDISNELNKAYSKNFQNSLILLGEAWLFSDLSLSENATSRNSAITKLNYPKNIKNFALFNDIARDSIAGSHYSKGLAAENKEKQAAYATVAAGSLINFTPGNVPYNRHEFINKYFSFADEPTRVLNFISIHDGLTLWDKINLQCGNFDKEKRAEILRKAYILLFTCQGKIILNSGEELLRTKPLAKYDKESSRALTSNVVTEEYGTTFLHENSYSSPDFTNMIRWSKTDNELKTKNIDFLKELIKIRRCLPALRMINRNNIKKGITFISNNYENNKTHVFSGFDDPELKVLKLKFINGPSNEVYYLTGDVHQKGPNANPMANKYYVPFNSNGIGEIVFLKSDIERFDLEKWGNPQLLDFKLIKTPGSWNTLNYSYSEMGNNIISHRAINNENTVEINLSIKDFSTGVDDIEYEDFMAWHINNKLENSTYKDFKKYNYSEIIVVHNFSNKSQIIETDFILKPQDWKLLCNNNRASIDTIDYDDSVLIIRENEIVVAAFQSLIIAKS